MRPLARRLGKLRAALLSALVLLATAPCLCAAGTAGRIEVPIYQVQLPNGTTRYWVPVTVGGKTLEAMLDTGSVGLRVFAVAVSPADYQDTGIETSVRYGSGVELLGMLARASVKIGEATTAEPVAIHIVRSAACTEKKPDCPFTKVDAADYGIGGDGIPRQGFKAILGLSLKRLGPTAAVNPLDYVGEQAWIVILPLPGAAAPGTLIVNPTSAERAGFRLIPFQVTEPPNRFPICVEPGQANAQSCPPVQLDSGARPGLAPFYSYAVLYDMKSNVVGIKPRADAAR